MHFKALNQTRNEVLFGVKMGGRWGKVCLACISETVRCNKVMLGRDIGLGVEVCNVMV